MGQKQVEVGDLVDVSSAAKGHFPPIGPILSEHLLGSFMLYFQ